MMQYGPSTIVASHLDDASDVLRLGGRPSVMQYGPSTIVASVMPPCYPQGASTGPAGGPGGATVNVRTQLEAAILKPFGRPRFRRADPAAGGGRCFRSENTQANFWFLPFGRARVHRADPAAGGG